MELIVACNMLDRLVDPLKLDFIVVDSLWDSVIVLCFVVCYFVSILVLQSSSKNTFLYVGLVLCRLNFCLVTNSTLLSFVLFDLILYIPSAIFQLCRDGSSWVEPVLS